MSIQSTKNCPQIGLDSIYDKATTQKDFTFDDGMPLSCKGSQKTYLRGLHSKKADPCRDGCPMMKFLQINAYVDWINARLAL